jgi:hypothetical protein
MDNKSKITSLAITSSLLLGSTGYLYFEKYDLVEKSILQQTEIASLNGANKNLSENIKELREKLDTFKGRNQELDFLLASANRELEIKDGKLRDLLSENASLSEIKSEYNKLIKINQKNIEQLKTLEALYAGAGSENNSLKNEISELKAKIDLLEAVNLRLKAKVDAASVLKSENITAITQRKSSRGEFVKSRLRKADRVLVTFEIAENKIADAGVKTVYVRLLDSRGNLVSTHSEVFENPDKNISIPYSVSQSVNYSNTSQKVIVPIEVIGEKYVKGTYVAEIYCDGNFSGMKKFRLR